LWVGPASPPPLSRGVGVQCSSCSLVFFGHPMKTVKKKSRFDHHSMAPRPLAALPEPGSPPPDPRGRFFGSFETPSLGLSPDDSGCFPPPALSVMATRKFRPMGEVFRLRGGIACGIRPGHCRETWEFPACKKWDKTMLPPSPFPSCNQNPALPPCCSKSGAPATQNRAPGRILEPPPDWWTVFRIGRLGRPFCSPEYSPRPHCFLSPTVRTSRPSQDRIVYILRQRGWGIAPPSPKPETGCPPGNPPPQPRPLQIDPDFGTRAPAPPSPKGRPLRNWKPCFGGPQARKKCRDGAPPAANNSISSFPAK